MSNKKNKQVQRIVHLAVVPNTLPRSLYRGLLKLGDVEIEAHVLSNGQRVLSTRGMVQALAGDGPKNADLGRLVERIPGNSLDFSLVPRIEFTIPGSPNGLGYPAEALADICDAYVDALIADALSPAQPKLHPKQRPIAERARQIQKAFVKVGIIALVDDATGYTQHRARNELAQKFAEYLLPEPGEWVRAYSPNFFADLARLYRFELRDPRRRPGFMGGFIQKYVYEAIDPDVAEELVRRVPRPAWGNLRHPHLTEKAREVLHSHLLRLGTVMRQSSDHNDFKMRFACEFKGAGLQLDLPPSNDVTKRKGAA